MWWAVCEIKIQNVNYICNWGGFAVAFIAETISGGTLWLYSQIKSQNLHTLNCIPFFLCDCNSNFSYDCRCIVITRTKCNSNLLLFATVSADISTCCLRTSVDRGLWDLGLDHAMIYSAFSTRNTARRVSWLFILLVWFTVWWCTTARVQRTHHMRIWNSINHIFLNLFWFQ